MVSVHFSVMIIFVRFIVLACSNVNSILFFMKRLALAKNCLLFDLWCGVAGAGAPTHFPWLIVVITMRTHCHYFLLQLLHDVSEGMVRVGGAGAPSPWLIVVVTMGTHCHCVLL